MAAVAYMAGALPYYGARCGRRWQWWPKLAWLGPRAWMRPMGAWVQLGVTQRCNRSRVIFGVSTGRVRRTESIGASSSFGLAVELDVCARMLEMLADENRTPTVHLGGPRWWRVGWVGGTCRCC